MTQSDPDTTTLLKRAGAGDDRAGQELLGRFRDRLRQMVVVRMDQRLTKRLDPSDVVQEALLAAHQKLPEYLEKRPIPFYPWLRQLAWERLVKLHLEHVQAKKRSVTREERDDLFLPDHSALTLAGRLVAEETSPSAHMVREETLARVREALGHLSARDQEILVLRHLEHLSVQEIAAVIGISPGAVKVRRLRALRRLRAALKAPGGNTERDR